MLDFDDSSRYNLKCEKSNICTSSLLQLIDHRSIAEEPMQMRGKNSF